MLSMRSNVRAKAKDEAEKPFWISYADLMTALMVLFLVVMCVTLLEVTKTVTEQQRLESQHNQDIERLLDRFDAVTHDERFKGITVDRTRRVIDFGARAQFPFARSTLTLEQQRLLRAFVPAILEKSDDELGKRVLKQIVVDGFTDKKGSYLSNLDLSLQRSQRVLCALFGVPQSGEVAMTPQQLEEVRALFLVGGYSFNAAKDTDEESRRVEMRLILLGVKEQRPSTSGIEAGNFGICALGP
ncbi:flagellar motor protein MotB [Rhodanobacter sp. C03]|uniref:OmpA/MotB family protein n=1 Tax=Rhodanobacter sp. C03 TaxID=1945858 RepID=UPI0009845F9E|nr:flagellar motor protein MotB [Rhodanobacter sp. C03]OOG59930.1 flagellar motor protein MotB [Rhodanobacter sp. C03]